MIRRSLFFLLISSCLPLALPQNQAPPTPVPAQSGNATTPQPKGLLKRPPGTPESRDASGKKVGRITLDVTVTDPAGKPAAGLTEADFTLLDNHQPAKIVSFQAADGPDSTQAILLVDEVNNSFQNVATERNQIIKFLSRDGRLCPSRSLSLFFPTQESSSTSPPRMEIS